MCSWCFDRLRCDYICVFQELDLSSETGDSSTASSSDDDEVVLLDKDRTKTTASQDSSTSSDGSYSEMEISRRDMPGQSQLKHTTSKSNTGPKVGCLLYEKLH